MPDLHTFSVSLSKFARLSHIFNLLKIWQASIGKLSKISESPRSRSKQRRPGGPQLRVLLKSTVLIGGNLGVSTLKRILRYIKSYHLGPIKQSTQKNHQIQRFLVSEKTQIQDSESHTDRSSFNHTRTCTSKLPFANVMHNRL